MSFKRLALHGAFWIFLFGARYYISSISINPYKAYTAGIVMNSLYATINIAIAYYLLVYVVYAQLLKRKRYAAGIAGMVALIALYTLLDYAAEMLMLQDAQWKAITLQYNPPYYAYLQQPLSSILLKRMATLGIVFQLFIGISLPLFIKTAMAYTQQQLQSLELAKQNVQLEFNFLKSQVNPHFLFNTLNNIYSLIIHDRKEQSADTVARLAAFMRYSLYEASADLIAAEKEIKLMNDYIALEQLRLNHTQVQHSLAAENPSLLLPPLLLMPVLENAFKYCPDRPGSFILIQLNASRPLQFVCRNTYDPADAPAATGGIGLNNLKKRLEQYYPGQYTYTVSSQENVYSVHLTIHHL